MTPHSFVIIIFFNIGLFHGFLSNKEWVTVVYWRGSRCGTTVYRYISPSIFFFASICFLSGRISVCLCMPINVS